MISLPDDLDGRTRAYRSRVAGRRILVVLDNAADESQVLPLLPGSSSCAVIVTSRSRLNLPGASPVMLDVLPADEAVELLARVSGPERVTADRDHAAEIVRLCGRLPIAIRIAGAVLARRPQQSLTRFAEQLTSERPLDVLSAGVSDDLRVSFSLSYRNLGADEQRQFRLLALLRTPDFPAWCGDVLTGTTGRIGHLVDAQLLEDDRGQEDIAGQIRYRCHDLLCAFAREQVEATETSEERLAALERLLSRYLVLSRTAGLRLQPVESWDETVVFRNGSLAWFIAEHTSLVAAVEQAAEAGLSTLAWQLTLSCEPFFERRAQWDSWQHTCDVAFAAATAAGDRHGEAHVLRGLGYVARERGDFRRSLGLLERSRSLFRELDDRFGEARVLCNLIRTHQDLGGFADAQECYRLALPVARESESRWLEANVERNMGMAHRDHGDATEALKYLEGALPLFRAAGDELLETYTMRDIGMVQRQLGRKETSMACFREALAGFERLGDQRGGARALNSLGVAYSEQHRRSDATTCFARSLALFREIGDRRWEAYTLRSLGELHCQLALEARQPGGTPRRRRAGQRALWHDAEASLLESRRILDELADRPWEAQTLLSLGDCYLHQNRRDKAIECLTRCLAVFTEIGNHKGQTAARELLDRARPDQNSVM
jgi:tetratricopeptide (TPR) repeat protein